MTAVPRISGQDIVRALERAGWTLVRINGSHHILKDATAHRVSVPVHGAATLPVVPTGSVIKQTGLSIDEFIALL